MVALVNMHEAKTHFSKLGERVAAGEEIIIGKAGKPYFRLMPLMSEKKVFFVPAESPERDSARTDDSKIIIRHLLFT